MSVFNRFQGLPLECRRLIYLGFRGLEWTQRAITNDFRRVKAHGNEQRMQGLIITLFNDIVLLL